jgi:hypothetical protein
MILTLTHIALIALAATNGPANDNPILKDLVEKGITMSDGTVAKLPPPILADGLDAAAQRAALENASDARVTLKDLMKKSYAAPVVVKVRTVKAFKDEKPAVRAVDLWFVVHGDWKTMTSKDFLDSVLKPKDETKSRVVLKSGELTEKERSARKLDATTRKGFEERFIYTTFTLFERVEVSATRFSVATSDEDSIVAAGRVDTRFDKDADFPNRWRPLLRDELAEIKPGPAKPFAHAGGYAKVTRLKEPEGAVLVECHIVYEESYGWFDGANLVKLKIPPMVQEKVKIFRRKLASAKDEKSSK